MANEALYTVHCLNRETGATERGITKFSHKDSELVVNYLNKLVKENVFYFAEPVEEETDGC